MRGLAALSSSFSSVHLPSFDLQGRNIRRSPILVATFIFGGHFGSCPSGGWRSLCTRCGGGRSLGESLPSYLLYFGFIRYLPGIDVFPLGWTIFVEETFYIFLPIIFGFILSFRRAVLFFAVMAAISIIWVKAGPHLGVPVTNQFLFLFPLTHWYCFASGILLYWVHANEFVSRHFLRNWNLSWTIDICALLIMLVTIRLRLTASFGLALFILVALSEYSLIGRLCRSKLLRYFGVSCFSIYLFHFLILDIFDGVKEQLFDFAGLSNSSVEVRFLILFPVVSVVCLASCLCVFNWIEKPCVDLGKRLIRRLQAGKTMEPPVLETSG